MSSLFEDPWLANNDTTAKVAEVRVFASGATRDTDANKLDFEGFLSPQVLQRYAEYMHANRKMADGSLRDSDNWQMGIPINQYRKSLLRHVMELWHDQRLHGSVRGKFQEDLLCAIMFNAMGMLFEILNGRADRGEPV